MAPNIAYHYIPVWPNKQKSRDQSKIAEFHRELLYFAEYCTGTYLKILYLYLLYRYPFSFQELFRMTQSEKHPFPHPL